MKKERKEKVDAVIKSVWSVVCILGIGMLGCTGIVVHNMYKIVLEAFGVLDLDISDPLLHVNISAFEDVILKNSTKSGRFGNYISNLDTICLWFGYLSFIIAAYLNFSSKAMKCFLVSFFFSHVLILIGYVNYGESMFMFFGLVYGFLMSFITAGYVTSFPKKFMKYLFLVVNICGMGYVFQLIILQLDFTSTFGQILLFSVIFPTFKEAGRACLIVVAKKLAVNKRIMCESGLCLPWLASLSTEFTSNTLRRTYSYLFYSWYYYLLAFTIRLQLSTIEDPFIATLILLIQTAQEIFMRLTILSRTEYYKRLTRRKSVKKVVKRMSTIIPTAAFFSQSKAEGIKFGNVKTKLTESEAIDKHQLKIAFYSFSLLVTMQSEYTAILGSSLVLYFDRNRMLLRPWGYYNTLDDPFGLSNFNVVSLLLWTLSQIALEVLVDSICVFFEARFGLDIGERSSKQPVLYLFAHSLAAYFAFVLVVSLNASNLSSCIGQSICECAWGNGISRLSLVQQYCELVYANVTTDIN